MNKTHALHSINECPVGGLCPQCRAPAYAVDGAEQPHPNTDPFAQDPGFDTRPLLCPGCQIETAGPGGDLCETCLVEFALYEPEEEPDIRDDYAPRHGNRYIWIE